jgi:hypothetical protein
LPEFNNARYIRSDTANRTNKKEVKMVPRYDIDEVKKRRIIDKAARLGGGEAKNYGA